MKRIGKATAIFMTLIMFLLGAAGCGNSIGASNNSSTESVVKKDREGNEFTVPKNITKIVSTAPANVEILSALGAADKLVCVDTYSEGIDGVPEDAVRMDFTSPNAEDIIALEPDIVIASSFNKNGNDDPFKSVKDAGIPVVYMPNTQSIDGIYEDIEFLADLTETEDKGKSIISDMKEEIDAIKKIGESIGDKKKIYFEIGSTPSLYSFGNGTFLNEIISDIGGENIFQGENSWISPSEESVISANPDIIFTNEGYIENAVDNILNRKGWEGVNAVKNKQVYLIDENSSSRPTQNVISAMKEMAKDAYPEEYKDEIK